MSGESTGKLRRAHAEYVVRSSLREIFPNRSDAPSLRAADADRDGSFLRCGNPSSKRHAYGTVETHGIAGTIAPSGSVGMRGKECTMHRSPWSPMRQPIDRFTDGYMVRMPAGSA